MNSFELLTYVLAFGFIVLTIFLSVALYELIQAVRLFKAILVRIHNSALDLVLFKDSMFVQILRTFRNLISN